MSNVNGVNQNVFDQINTANQKASTSKSQTEEDSDMFMRLMIAQLQNQDPSSPADTSDFMQQIATMSQVESINQLEFFCESKWRNPCWGVRPHLQASAMVGQSVYIPGDTV